MKKKEQNRKEEFSKEAKRQIKNLKEQVRYYKNDRNSYKALYENYIYK